MLTKFSKMKTYLISAVHIFRDENRGSRWRPLGLAGCVCLLHGKPDTYLHFLHSFTGWLSFSSQSWPPEYWLSTIWVTQKWELTDECIFLVISQSLSFEHSLITLSVKSQFRAPGSNSTFVCSEVLTQACEYAWPRLTLQVVLSSFIGNLPFCTWYAIFASFWLNV